MQARCSCCLCFSLVVDLEDWSQLWVLLLWASKESNDGYGQSSKLAKPKNHRLLVVLTILNLVDHLVTGAHIVAP